MGRQAAIKESYIFSVREITDIYTGLRLPPLSSAKVKKGELAQQRSEVDLKIVVERIIEVMRAECYVIMKGPKLFKLQTG
jgi:hypothetical protein